MPTPQMMQVLAFVAPTVVEYLPAAQLLQDMVWIVPLLLNLPAVHKVQVTYAQSGVARPGGHLGHLLCMLISSPVGSSLVFGSGIIPEYGVLLNW
jgi:hypothetical protein